MWLTKSWGFLVQGKQRQSREGPRRNTVHSRCPGPAPFNVKIAKGMERCHKMSATGAGRGNEGQRWGNPGQVGVTWGAAVCPKGNLPLPVTAPSGSCWGNRKSLYCFLTSPSKIQVQNVLKKKKKSVQGRCSGHWVLHHSTWRQSPALPRAQ